jgi:hypothetical protein
MACRHAARDGLNDDQWNHRPLQTLICGHDASARHAGSEEAEAGRAKIQENETGFDVAILA